MVLLFKHIYANDCLDLDLIHKFKTGLISLKSARTPLKSSITEKKTLCNKYKCVKYWIRVRIRSVKRWYIRWEYQIFKNSNKFYEFYALINKYIYK